MNKEQRKKIITEYKEERLFILDFLEVGEPVIDASRTLARYDKLLTAKLYANQSWIGRLFWKH